MIWTKWYMIVFVYWPIFLYIWTYINAISLTMEIRRKYTISKSGTRFIETFTSYINHLITCFIPVYNLLLVIIILNRDVWREKYLDKLRQENRLKEKD